MSEPRYPKIKVQLAGKDGNAFAIIGRVQRALRKGNVPETEVRQFLDEATSGDYNNVLETCTRWVDVS